MLQDTRTKICYKTLKPKYVIRHENQNFTRHKNQYMLQDTRKRICYKTLEQEYDTRH